ncbi:GNAT family N-acetyltransferase [Chloroflexota bacterium]
MLAQGKSRMVTNYRKYIVNDYDRVLNFFRDLYHVSDNVPFWLPSRWEYAEYLASPLHKYRGLSIDWKETIYLWEIGTGAIVAILCSENPDENIFLHTKPEFRYLEAEMVNVAEEQIICGTLNKSIINIWCQSGDSYRELLLQKRGYSKQTFVEYLNWRDLDEQLLDIKMPDGYTLHNMVSEEGLDLENKITRMTGAFDSEPYPVDIYRNMQCARSYRKEFDLYSTDSDGSVCSYCIIWYDEELNVGYFEPVGTDANHRGKGLGQATISAGLKCLMQAEVSKAYVGSAGDDRRSFYNASGFTNSVAFHPWRKELKKRAHY